MNPIPGSSDTVHEPPIHCPVHRVEISPCSSDELQPLLAHLKSNLAVKDRQAFARGTLMPDGRLDLCKQSLGTGNCVQLVEALRANTQVRSLMLGTDAIGDVGAAAVAELATVNRALEVLYLGCNNIGPAGVHTLCDALANNVQVSGLWLKRNPIGPEGAKSIADLLRHTQNLRVLDLTNTDIRGSGVADIVEALCNGNRSVNSLYVSGNGLGAAAAHTLGRLLQHAPHVTALYVSANHLGDEGAMVLAAALHNNTKLQVLELASNGVGPSGAKALFAAVAQHPSLQMVKLGYAASTKALGAQANSMGDEGAGYAAAMLAANTSLRTFDLTRNGVTTAGMTVLASGIMRSESLGSLVIDACIPVNVATHLAGNAAKYGVLQRPDLAMIKSVYR